MTESAGRNCPRCSTPLPASAPQGLCPRCLLEMHLSPPTILTGEAGTTPAPEPPSLERMAALFPQLEILECLGRGGMGVVYKARQKSLERLVALKILAPEREREPEFARRFAREAQALARLNHPHIVTVHDFGEVKSDDGNAFFYLLMEFVDGVNLRHLLRNRRLQPKEALAIVPPVCEALQYAHDHGIVHRDIKPENLLLDQTGRVKIADFGIAQMLDAEVPGHERSAGTPEYMAPEQRASPESADHRADIYSLGVVLYEMLTGELPQGKFARPSQKVQLDVRLDQIVLRALHQEPELRYRTALDLKTQIELIAADPSEPFPTAPAEAEASPLRRSQKKTGEAIMKTESNETKVPTRPQRRRLAAITGLVLLPCIVLLGAHYSLPSEYFAKVTMEVRQDNSRATGDAFGSATRVGNDPMFVPTQLQALQKKVILYPVLEKLDLVNKWPTEGGKRRQENAYLKLRRMLDLRDVRNSEMIDIGVYSTDAQEAANIANTVAVVYRQLRLEDLRQSVDSSLDQLREEVEKQRKIVEKGRVEMDKIREQGGIGDSDPESSTSTMGELGSTGAHIVELDKQIFDQRALITRLEGQHEETLKLKPEQLQQMLRALNVQNETVVKMVSSLQDAVRAMTELSNEGRGERHPSILALRAQAKVFQDQLSDQLAVVQQAQANKLATEKRTLAELETRFKSVQEHQIREKEQQSLLRPLSLNYVRAKNHYLQEKAIYQAAHAKLATEALQAGIDFDPAKIWEKAEPSLHPAPFSLRGLWRRAVQ